MKRIALATASLCALAAAASHARAAGLDTYPLVAPGVADKACGYTNAAGHATQCYTIQNIANLAPATPPGGASTQVEFNNGGAFGGVAGFTWNGSTLTLPPTTLPDGGTLTSTLNTFAKPSFYGGADNTPADTIDSSGSHFGTIFATGADAWALGVSSSSTSAGAGVINWSQSAGSNNIDLTVNGAVDINGNFNFKDATGATTWATGVFSGGVGKLNIPFGGVLKMSGAGFSADGASSAVLDLGNGSPGDKTGQLNLTGLTATGVITMPDGGTLRSTGTDTFFSSLYINGSTTGTPKPTIGNGGVAFWSDDTAEFAGSGGGGKFVGMGAVFFGKAFNNCNVPPVPWAYCDNFDLGLSNGGGYIVAGIQNGGGGTLGHWFTIGLNRISPAPATGSSETATEQSQLYIGDAYVSGNATAPGLTFGNGTASIINGIGQKSVGSTALRFGGVGNLETVWDDRAADQPDISTAGCLELGWATGGQFDGGQGVAWHEKLCDTSSGILKIWNNGKTAAAAVEVAFERQDGVTLSALTSADPSPATGDRATITDAAACTFGSSVTGGGSTACPVVYLSGAWKAG